MGVDRYEITKFVDDPFVYDFIFDWLLGDTVDRAYTEEEVVNGLDRYVYATEAEAIATPPADPTSPAFRVVAEDRLLGYDIKLVYWDWASGVGGSWSVTSYPWAFPFLSAGYLIELDNSIGSGASSWTYQMGTEFRTKTVCNITEVAFKWGTGGPGLNHAWTLFKSTTPGPTPPLLSTYTIVAAQSPAGGVAYSVANQWEQYAIPGGPVAAALNDWWALVAYVGNASGQSQSIATIPPAFLNEDFAELYAGIYVTDLTGPPGAEPSPTPSSRTSTTIYGIASVELGP